MTTPALRDLDRALQSLLEAGPDQLSNRVSESIADEIHRTRQRAPLGPWRIPPMSRFTFAAAALAAAVVVVVLAVVLTRPAAQTGGQPSPAQPAPTPSPTSAASPSPAIGPLLVGKTYRASSFSMPYTFTVPSPAASMQGPVAGDALNPAHTLRIRPASGALTFHDGIGLPSDLCHPEKGLLARLPGTPQAVGAWLSSTKGLGLSRRPDMSVASGVVLSWDVSIAATCYTGSGPFTKAPDVWTQANEHHRLYAVPTGTGTILIITWANGYNGQGEDVLPAVNAWADELVRTIRFG
jgi:hypothetical protein